MPNDRLLRKVSVAEAVETVVERNFVLEEALRMKVANYHSVAKSVAPRVEEITGSKSKLATLVVAVKRLSDRLEEQRTAELGRVLEGATVTLSGGIVEVTVAMKGTHPGLVLGEVAKAIQHLSVVPEVSALPSMVKVLALREEGIEIQEKLGAAFSTTMEDGLAKVNIRLGSKAENLRGILSMITEVLYRNGVFVRSAYMGRPEISIVVDERLGGVAYDTLRARASGS